MGIKGLKEAIEEYRNWLEGHPGSAQIMLDRSNGKVWTDVHCNCSDRCNYTDPAIICVSDEIGIDFDFTEEEIANEINGVLECYCEEYVKIKKLRALKVKGEGSCNCGKEKNEICGLAGALAEYYRTKHRYGMAAYIMLDRATGDVWTDVVGDNDNRYTYPSDAIVCISESYARDMLGCEDIDSTRFVEFARRSIADYTEGMISKDA